MKFDGKRKDWSILCVAARMKIISSANAQSLFDVAGNRENESSGDTWHLPGPWSVGTQWWSAGRCHIQSPPGPAHARADQHTTTPALASKPTMIEISNRGNSEKYQRPGSTLNISRHGYMVTVSTESWLSNYPTLDSSCLEKVHVMTPEYNGMLNFEACHIRTKWDES